jgi:hypothetical protein
MMRDFDESFLPSVSRRLGMLFRLRLLAWFCRCVMHP